MPTGFWHGSCFAPGWAFQPFDLAQDLLCGMGAFQTFEIVILAFQVIDMPFGENDVFQTLNLVFGESKVFQGIDMPFGENK